MEGEEVNKNFQAGGDPLPSTIPLIHLGDPNPCPISGSPDTVNDRNLKKPAAVGDGGRLWFPETRRFVKGTKGSTRPLASPNVEMSGNMGSLRTGGTVVASMQPPYESCRCCGLPIGGLHRAPFYQKLSNTPLNVTYLVVVQVATRNHIQDQGAFTERYHYLLIAFPNRSFKKPYYHKHSNWAWMFCSLLLALA